MGDAVTSPCADIRARAVAKVHLICKDTLMDFQLNNLTSEKNTHRFQLQGDAYYNYKDS